MRNGAREENGGDRMIQRLFNIMPLALAVASLLAFALGAMVSLAYAVFHPSYYDWTGLAPASRWFPSIPCRSFAVS